MSLHTLQSDTWRLWCDPNRGAQWTAAEVNHHGQWHPVVPDCRDEVKNGAGQHDSAPLAAANFHMIPYSNRIRDGKFNFQGKTIQLEGAQGHAIHGAVRKLPWKVISSDSSHLMTEFQSTDHSSVNWPWPFVSTIEQRLSADTVISKMTLTNQGKTAMPAGMGWHPYFVRVVNGSQPTLTLPTTGVFPDTNGDCLPIGKPVSLPPELDFSTARQLDPKQPIDHCMSGFAGTAEIHWAEAGIKLTMQASNNCSYLILYNPEMPHFAVEPVTNANDAFNLSNQSIPSGTTTLEPGETLTATMTVKADIK